MLDEMVARWTSLFYAAAMGHDQVVERKVFKLNEIVDVR
jgi:hypothetical protein